MKPDTVKYESCQYYADKGNEVAMEFFNTYYPDNKKTYYEPDDRHSVFDLRLDIDDENGKRIRRYYVEVKLKFDKRFFTDSTMITSKKVGEINAFMNNRDRKNVKFLYMCYYPMNGNLVLFNMTNPKEYETTKMINWSATAAKTDITPYMDTVEYCLLPMGYNPDYKHYTLNSNVEIKYNGHTYKGGKEIN